MTAKPSSPWRCGAKLPPPRTETTVTIVKAPATPAVPQEIDFFAQSASIAARLENALATSGYRVEFIGYFRSPAGNVLIERGDCWCAIGDRITLDTSSRKVAARLAATTVGLELERLRVIYVMPRGWTPLATMRPIAQERILRGSVIDDRRLVGVPVTANGSRYTTWLGVDPRRRVRR